MCMTDHYATLGVSKTATQEEIKQAYRKLASLNHPDKGGDTAKFQTIQSAYEVLGTVEKRAEYDNPRPQFGGGGGAQHFNMHDIFGHMFGGQSPFAQPQAARRNHVRMVVPISLLDVATGGSRTINVSTSAGSSTVQVGIPKGINDGDNVQYGGVAPGGLDLVVQYRVIPDSKWRRDGLNLHTEQQVNIWDMILGTDLEVTTLTGDRLSVKVQASTQPNTTMRLKSRGLQDQNGQSGDLLVKLLALIPNPVSPEIVAAIQQHRT